MGIFTSTKQRAYTPLLEPSSGNTAVPLSSTLLGETDGGLKPVQVSGGDGDTIENQIAQQPTDQGIPSKATNVDTGNTVVLPNGSAVPDRYSPSGKLMSPVADLSNVAEAGRNAGNTYRVLRSHPATFEAGTMLNAAHFGFSLGHGGDFDYQRGPGNSITGFVQRPQFRNVSNVNVGLFGQQAGLSLDDVLRQAGEFARLKSLNATPADPYGLDPRTREFIELGHRIGASNVFGPAAIR
jgi:hypothetical protein